jgi:hypothetical protein
MPRRSHSSMMMLSLGFVVVATIIEFNVRAFDGTVLEFPELWKGLRCFELLQALAVRLPSMQLFL